MVTEPKIGQPFGKYTIVRKLGAGGMGAVYEAKHGGLRRRVAIKTLARHVAEIPGAVERFVREGRLAARVRHPNIVDVLDVGVQDSTPYLVMEYLEGEDLGRLLAREKRISPRATAEALVPVVAAVSAAHAAGVIHRDLKPENIVLTSDSAGALNATVVDFGISKASRGDGDTSVELTDTGALLGTPHYMALEQARNAKSVDARTDVYSLGVILYRCLTGEVPFRGDTLLEVIANIGAGEFRRPRAIVPGLSDDVERVVLRAMALDPNDRYPSAAALGLELLKWAPNRTRFVYAAELQRADSVADPFSTTVPNVPDVVPEGGSPSTLGASVRASRSRPRDRGLVVAVVAGSLALAVAAVALVAWDRASSPPAASPDPRFVVSVQATPLDARITLDHSDTAVGSYTRALRVDGARHELVVSREGYASRTFTFVDAPPPGIVTLDQLPPVAILPASTVVDAGQQDQVEHVASSEAPDAGLVGQARVRPHGGAARIDSGILVEGANGSLIMR